MDTLRVGIIGCGQICRVRHAPEYSENPRCQIAGFYDVDPARAQAMAKQYGGKAFDSVEALLDADIDAVSVCSANTDHRRSAIMAMENRYVTSVEGIIDEDVDRSIRNLTKIGSQGMNETDRLVLQIMTQKQ